MPREDERRERPFQAFPGTGNMACSTFLASHIIT